MKHDGSNVRESARVCTPHSVNTYPGIQRRRRSWSAALHSTAGTCRHHPSVCRAATSSSLPSFVCLTVVWQKKACTFQNGKVDSKAFFFFFFFLCCFIVDKRGVQTASSDKLKTQHPFILPLFCAWTQHTTGYRWSNTDTCHKDES